MQSRVFETIGRPSVRPSVCLSVLLTIRPFVRPIIRCGGFAAVDPAAMRHRSLAARPAAGSQQHGAQQQMRAVPRCPLT